MKVDAKKTGEEVGINYLLILDDNGRERYRCRYIRAIGIRVVGATAMMPIVKAIDVKFNRPTRTRENRA